VQSSRIASLDLETYLSSSGIDYRTEGKNVGRKCVGICCPFCQDETYHLGVFRDHKNWKCFRCHKNGSFSDLLRVLFPDDWYSRLNELGTPTFHEGTAKDQIQALIRGAGRDIEEEEHSVVLPVAISVNEIVRRRHSLLDAFLTKRQISVDTCRSYAASVALLGRYMNRLVIPVWKGNKLVGFQARDMTGKAEIKYDSPPESQHKQVLYPEPSLSYSSRIILVEGPLDAWRMGPGSVCSFGTSLTEAQKRMLYASCPSEVIFAWDEHAYWKAREAARELLSFVPIVRVAKLCGPEDTKEWDPDRLGYERTMQCVESATVIS